MLDEFNDKAVQRARSLGWRGAHGFVMIVAVLFIGASGAQLVEAVFATAPPKPDGVSPGALVPPDTPCDLGVSHLARALDRAAARAFAAAASAADGDDAVLAFRHALSPEWDEEGAVAEACKTFPGGLDTWATLERLRVSEEQLARQSRVELGPVRREVTAHLPADLR